jgi:hypothetical protein
MTYWHVDMLTHVILTNDLSAFNFQLSTFNFQLLNFRLSTFNFWTLTFQFLSFNCCIDISTCWYIDMLTYWHIDIYIDCEIIGWSVDINVLNCWSRIVHEDECITTPPIDLDILQYNMSMSICQCQYVNVNMSMSICQSMSICRYQPSNHIFKWPPQTSPSKRLHLIESKGCNALFYPTAATSTAARTAASTWYKRITVSLKFVSTFQRINPEKDTSTFNTFSVPYATQ